MTVKFYLIDGKNYTSQEVLSLFQASKLGKREKLVIAMINNPDDNKCILDLGCLYGFFSKKLKEQFPKSTIIAGDYLDEHIEISCLQPYIAP